MFKSSFKFELLLINSNSFLFNCSNLFCFNFTCSNCLFIFSKSDCVLDSLLLFTFCFNSSFTFSNSSSLEYFSFKVSSICSNLIKVFSSCFNSSRFTFNVSKSVSYFFISILKSVLVLINLSISLFWDSLIAWLCDSSTFCIQVGQSSRVSNLDMNSCFSIICVWRVSNLEFDLIKVSFTSSYFFWSFWAFLNFTDVLLIKTSLSLILHLVRIISNCLLYVSNNFLSDSNCELFLISSSFWFVNFSNCSVSLSLSFFSVWINSNSFNICFCLSLIWVLLLLIISIFDCFCFNWILSFVKINSSILILISLIFDKFFSVFTFFSVRDSVAVSNFEITILIFDLFSITDFSFSLIWFNFSFVCNIELLISSKSSLILSNPDSLESSTFLSTFKSDK